MLQEITRAAAVLRVSSAGQTDDDKDSIGNQRRLAETMADRHGWELVAEYDETAEKGFQSGRAKMNDRPYIQKMLAEAKAGAFDVVIFRDPSRLGRHDGEALSLGYDLRDEGVLVAFSADN
jgi:DNA invertase Pin-like site-specific DNA recombinase